MQFFRRYAWCIAALVFLTSGPLAAWHVAGETVRLSPRGMGVVGTATVAEAHDLRSVPEGTGCLVCHLLQQVRMVVAVAGVPASTCRPATQASVDQTPRDLAVADRLPARSPPPALA